MTDKRAQEIQERIANYDKDSTTVPSWYSPEGIASFREMRKHAPDDIRDLLAERGRLRAALREIAAAGVPFLSRDTAEGFMARARRALEE